MDKNSKGCLILAAPLIVIVIGIMILSVSDNKKQDVNSSSTTESERSAVIFKETGQAFTGDLPVEKWSYMYAYAYKVRADSLNQNQIMNHLRRHAASHNHINKDQVNYFYFYEDAAPPYRGYQSIKELRAFLAQYPEPKHAFKLLPDSTFQPL